MHHYLGARGLLHVITDVVELVGLESWLQYLETVMLQPLCHQAAITCLPSVIVNRAVALEPPLPPSDTTTSLSPGLRDDTASDSGNTAVRKRREIYI